MDSSLRKLSNNKLLQEYQYNSETLKLFDEPYWTGAFYVSEEIKHQCRALHQETLEVQQHLQIELAQRTLVRIRTRLRLVKGGLSSEESDQNEPEQQQNEEEGAQ